MHISIVLFLLMLLAYCGTAWYVWRTRLSSYTNKRVYSHCYTIATLVITAYMLYVMSSIVQHDALLPELVAIWSLFSFLSLFLSLLTYTLLSLVIRLLPSSVTQKRGVKVGTSVIAATLFATMWIGALFGRTHIVTTQVTAKFEQLPEGFDGYRIAQISDIHLRGGDSERHFMQQLADEIESLDVNLVVFTGDLVNGQSNELESETMPIMARMRGREGTYSILGNHDYAYALAHLGQEAKNRDVATLIAKQEEMGWRMLNNSHTLLTQEGDTLALIGVENWGEPPFSQIGRLDNSYPDLNDSRFKILLSHNPNHWDKVVTHESNIALTLSGHTHAMQSKLPIGSRGWSPAVWTYKQWFGLYHKADQQLYVNQGIGYVGIPMRAGNAYPEITVITLKKKRD